MTNTVLPDRAFGIAVDLPKNSKELPTWDLRSDGLIDNTTPSMIESRRDERRRNRAPAITNFPMCHRHGSHEISGSHSGAAIQDFEEISQAADFPIATPPQLLGSVRGPNANPRRF
jgi:hypothetical protein